MTTPMTVILGAGADARSVRSALVDLAAIGMIDRFLWAESVADGREADPVVDDVCHTRADGLSVRRDTLSGALVGADGRDVLLVVLDMAEDAHHEDANISNWRSCLKNQLNTDVEILHLYVPHRGSQPMTQYGDVPTLIVSPEQAATPLDHRSPVKYPAAQHTAVSLASIAGLWSTSSTSPFYDAVNSRQITGAFGQAQLVRTFHNYSDAANAEKALYERVFSLEGNMPHPLFDSTRRLFDVGDNDEAIMRYADALMKSYDKAFVSPLTELDKIDGRSVGAFEAIGQFLGQFFRSVFGTPQQHVNEAVKRGSGVLAKGVQKLLYGSDSNVEVVLAGQSGKGHRPLAEVEAGVESLKQDIGGGDDLNLSEDASLPQFWQAYASAALALVDGGSRSASNDDVPGPNYDGTPAIVSDVRWSVACDDDAFEGENKIVRDYVGSHISETRIQPYDPYNASVYESAIERVSRNTRNTTVHQLKDDFRSWKQQVSRSFGWQIGERLFANIEKAQAKLHTVREQAQATQAQLDALPDDAGKQKALTRTLRAWFVLWLVLIAGVVYFCLSHYNPASLWSLVDWGFFTWQRSLLVAIVISAVVLVIQMLVFAAANKGMYDRRERKRVLTTNRGILEKDAVTAYQEVGRCLASYHQFLAWSAIVGRVLAQPFGKKRTIAEASHHPDSGLPDNTVVDFVELSDVQLDDYACKVRDEIFTVGWADEALDRYLSEGIKQARTRLATVEESYRLYGQLGVNSQLAEIADACRRGELFAGADYAHAKWQESLQLIRSSSNVLGDRHGQLATAMARIDNGQTQSAFYTQALSEMGTNNDAGNVNDLLTFAESSQGEHTLSHSYTVVQYGHSADTCSFDTSSSSTTTTPAHESPSVPTFGEDSPLSPPAFGHVPRQTSQVPPLFGQPETTPGHENPFGGLM